MEKIGEARQGLGDVNGESGVWLKDATWRDYSTSGRINLVARIGAR